MPEIGDVKRRCDVGLKGKTRVTWMACSKCERQRWVMPKQQANNVCNSCNQRDVAARFDLNSFTHKDDCKCQKCRMGKGYFKGSNNPMWGGGVKQLKSGYIQVYISDEHPMASMRAYNGNNYVMEHRLVMANHIGRPLLKHETVHHRNGIKSDNRIVNLELWVSKHHSGQRLSELCCPHCGKNIYNHFK